MSIKNKSKYNVGIVNKIDKKNKKITVDEYEFYSEGNEYEKGDIVFYSYDKQKRKGKVLDFYLYKDAIKELGTKKVFNCDNINLLINKISNKITLSKNIRNENFSIAVPNSEIYEYIDEQANLLEKTSLYEVVKSEFSVMNKMVVGYGGTTTYNNDITLHHIYGVPYIPGQAIKGVLKHYISNYSDDDNKKALLKYLGDEDKKGDVIFFDSFPKKGCKIVMDVMSVHHKDYYTKEESFPTDDDNPIVIKFLAVEGDFIIRLGISKELVKKDDFEKTILDTLKDALYKVGIGGKTSLGYGTLVAQENIDNSFFESLLKLKEKFKNS